MPIRSLHPSRRELGTHVLLLLGRREQPRPFHVVDTHDRVLSEHLTLEAACARSRWHSGTRFVYVEFEGANDGQCWDGLLGRLVEWSEALATMSAACCARDRERQGLAGPRQPLASVRRITRS